MQVYPHWKCGMSPKFPDQQQQVENCPEQWCLLVFRYMGNTSVKIVSMKQLSTSTKHINIPKFNHPRPNMAATTHCECDYWYIIFKRSKLLTVLTTLNMFQKQLCITVHILHPTLQTYGPLIQKVRITGARTCSVSFNMAQLFRNECCNTHKLNTDLKLPLISHDTMPRHATALWPY